jgi:hypothetical protein
MPPQTKSIDSIIQKNNLIEFLSENSSQDGSSGQVRQYITPADSSRMVQYASWLTNKSPEEIAKAYSSGVAGVPIFEKPGMFKEEGRVGKWTYSPDKELSFDPSYKPSWTGKKEWGESLWRTPQNSILHEAFGHGLLQSLYGYYPKKTPFVRTEILPYLMQALSSRGTEKENPRIETILFKKMLEDKKKFQEGNYPKEKSNE